MKLIHLSDLHLGKRLNEFSLLADQKYILSQILSIAKEIFADGVIISGDVYDKSVPSLEAVELFDSFLVELSKANLKTFVISGNHDSPERLAFGEKLMQKSGIFISPSFSGKIEPITLTDDYGKINFYLLPFIKPAHVKRFFNEDFSSYTTALKKVIDGMEIDQRERNLLITHQFVTGAVRSESEEITVGGTDNVDAEVFTPFDYVALGHIHKPQNVSEKIRYCGTPLKYSFSELNHQKSVTVIEFKEKGNLIVSTIPLKPLRDLAEIKGTYLELTKKDFYENSTFKNDYLSVILTDENDVIDAMAKLRVIYPYIMKLSYDNSRTRQNMLLDQVENAENLPPIELFSNLYQLQNNKPLTSEQKNFVEKLIEDIWGGEN